MRFPREEHCSGLPFPSPGVLPDTGIKPVSSALAGRFFTAKPRGKPSYWCCLLTSVVSGSSPPPELYSLPGSSVHGILQEQYWSGLPFPSPGELPDPGIEPTSLTSLALAGGFFITSATCSLNSNL